MTHLQPGLSLLLKTALRCLSFLLAFPLLASAAIAGDTAKAEILGFSKDGAYFAFEQYGIQDGSGFPYSEIFVLDVANDRWVKPSPFLLRNQNEDEIEAGGIFDPDALVTAVRSENREKAQQLLQTTRIAGKGLTAGHNPRTELNSDPFRMVVAPRDFFRPGEDELELNLNEYLLTSDTCAGIKIDDTRGFRLTMTYKGQIRVLNEDTSLPESRGCPLAYRVERIVTHFPEDGPPVYAVLIQMDTHGFEGPDRRYLAITGQL
ncbi:DUF2259 domain-containing protein [Roseibium marinum]|uniref:Putative secreted protein n=1 Tax=Roseibium marinum TaxID=281252 RepID=A0A2S3UK70_9HYPH|nr:DUF2259 domain-containing protein [Roseibium marinum]POF28118.1 putative secreted protein [Roseibium marinum]